MFGLCRVNLNNFKVFISKQLYRVVLRKMMVVFKRVIRYFVWIKSVLLISHRNSEIFDEETNFEMLFFLFFIRAAEALKQCGPTVTLQVLKDAASRQGLSALLSKPSEHNHHHHQQQQLARFPATSNPSLLTLQHQHQPMSASTTQLKSTGSHERLLTHSNGHQHHHQQHQFATLGHPPHYHQQQQQQQQMVPPRPASRSQVPVNSSSYEFVYNAKSVPITNINPHQRFSQHEIQQQQQRLVQPARSAQVLIDEETSDDLIHEYPYPTQHQQSQQQHQSNPNLYHSNGNQQYPFANNRNQTFDLPKRTTYPNGHNNQYEHDESLDNGHEHEDEQDEDDIQPTNFVRTASERQSFGDRNLATAPALIFREDVPPNQNGYTNGNHQMKPINHTQSAIGPAIAPKTLPKPMMSSLALMKQTNGTNESDISSRLSKASLSSSSDHLSSSMRKPNKLANSRQNNISEIRIKRINDLITRNDRTDQEEKELNNLRLEHDFDRRVEEFHLQTNGNDIDEDRMNLIQVANVLPAAVSPTGTDEMNEFDEKLKRRLEQFEHDRQIERTQVNRLQAKREADIEARLRKDRDVRSDRDIRDLKIRRMSEEDRSIEAKKEQARLSKHVRLPDSPPVSNESIKHSSSTGHIPNSKDNIDNHQAPPVPPPPPTRDISFAVANNIKQTLIQRTSNEHHLISPPLPPPPPPVAETSPTSSIVAIPVASLQAVERITAELTRRDDFYTNEDNINHYTPSVIGAQEVYLDPRFRTKRYQQQNGHHNGINKENLNNDDKSGVTTETMSFRDKLKFFRKPPDQNE